MWIFAKNGFLSIVQHRDQRDTLMVRGRIKGDIEHYFPDAKFIYTPAADYAYRASIAKEQAAALLAQAITTIDYEKFKPAVTDKRRASYYFSIWDTGYQMQEGLKPVDAKR